MNISSEIYGLAAQERAGPALSAFRAYTIFSALSSAFPA
jgi:hypothetical protein